VINLDANVLLYAINQGAPLNKRARSWLETTLLGTETRRGFGLSTVGTAGNLTSDAHLAALALEQRAEICSFDKDFMRFPGLKWRNPLA
jgi:predicted nucleic acid-binding protein